MKNDNVRDINEMRKKRRSRQETGLLLHTEYNLKQPNKTSLATMRAIAPVEIFGSFFFVHFPHRKIIPIKQTTDFEAQSTQNNLFVALCEKRTNASIE